MSFDPSPILHYLELAPDSKPSLAEEPVEFLRKYIKQIPPQLLATLSDIVTPKQRTSIPVIRNRRYKYTLSEPDELKFDEARKRWPTLWRGARDRREQQQEAADERQWAEREFLDGRHKQHIGKLGSLLGDYAEEREGERLRELRRAHAERQPDFMPEEEDSDEEEFEEELAKTQSMPELQEEAKDNFERLIREQFIYGFLDSIDYDAIDWNDTWDDGSGAQEDEDRWFDEEEENETEDNTQSTGEYDY